MKTFLLSLLLLTTAARADHWLVDGRLYKGTIHRLNADRTLVFVTSDWDNYGGSWIKVSSLDSSTRVRLNVAAPQEQAHYKTAREQQPRTSAQAIAAQSAAYFEQQRLAYERLLAARGVYQTTTQPYVAPRSRHTYASSYRYSTYRRSQSSYGYGYSLGSLHHHHGRCVYGPRVAVPHVVIPRVPCIVVPRPIIIRVN